MDEQDHPIIISDICSIHLDQSNDNYLAHIYTLMLKNSLIMQLDEHLGRDPYQRAGTSDKGFRN